MSQCFQSFCNKDTVPHCTHLLDPFWSNELMDIGGFFMREDLLEYIMNQMQDNNAAVYMQILISLSLQI